MAKEYAVLFTKGLTVSQVQGVETPKLPDIQDKEIAQALNKMTEYDYILVPGLSMPFTQPGYPYTAMFVFEREK